MADGNQCDCFTGKVVNKETLVSLYTRVFNGHT